MRSRFSGVVVAGIMVGAALLAVPALAQPVFCPGGGPLSSCAAWADMNGNREYDPGTDELIGMTNDLYHIYLWATWDCLDGYDVMMSKSNGGNYDQAFIQGYTLAITGFDGSGNPDTFSLSDRTGVRGTATLVDNDGDGCSDGLDARLAGGDVFFQTEFETIDTDDDGEGDHVSANWTYSSQYGMGGGCGPGTEAQIWVPMNNGRVVPGFQETYSSGCLRRFAPNVPTLSEWGVVLLGLGLVAFGWWLLRTRRALA